MRAAQEEEVCLRVQRRKKNTIGNPVVGVGEQVGEQVGGRFGGVGVVGVEGVGGRVEVRIPGALNCHQTSPVDPWTL